MLTAPAPDKFATHALHDIGVAAFPSLPSHASRDLDGDVEDFLREVCQSSDCASDLLSRRRAALLFPHVAGAPLQSRESDGVLRVGATTHAYYHLVTPPCGRRTRPFGLAIFFAPDAADDWRDYRIPFGQSGLMASLGLEGARLLRIQHHH